MPHTLWPAAKPKTIFDGDGRVYLNPVNAPAGTRPMRVSRKNAQRYIKWFHEKGGVSDSHSAAGQTVWVLVTHCIEQGYDYTVEPHYIDGKTAGWSIRKL